MTAWMILLGGCGLFTTTAEVPLKPGQGPKSPKVAQPLALPAVVPPVAAAVELVPEGTKFEPALTLDQVPEGGWFCDMGTAHYAASEPGSGACPVCGMKLVQQAAAARGADAAVPAEPAGHDHE